MKKTIGLIIFLSSLLSSCGGAVIGPTAASGAITSTTEAQTVKTGFDALLARITPANLQSPGNIATVPGVTTSAISPKAASAFDACTTITPTTAVDADGDGVAASKKYEYNCIGVAEPGHPAENRLGTITISDDDTVPASQGGAYSFAYDVQFSSSHYQSTWEGEFSLTRDQGKLTYGSRFKAFFSESDYAGTWESNYTYELNPTDPASPWDAGTAAMSGFYRLQASGTVSNQHVDYDYTWEMSSGNLEYEQTGTSGCVNYYKNGYIQFKDAGNNLIRYEFTCSAVSYSLNGTAIP
ncbi:MAG: hypothetical protein KDD33_03385 [Bdellovibrionales bacterium]|nr:hypothetical protein [Bdellovibrionales bacterium]